MRSHRFVLLVPLVVAVVVSFLGSPPAAGTTATLAPPAVGYGPPVPVRVLRGFALPAGPYGPGHRGVDLAAHTGDAVRAAADGVVTFAGSVAGRGVVVVAHADGVRTEYEPLHPAVRAGARVRRGRVIGVVTGRHHSCLPATCVHWGARRDLVYLDPLSLLRPLGPVRLLPWPRDG